MINKLAASVADALADVRDGATVIDAVEGLAHAELERLVGLSIAA